MLGFYMGLNAKFPPLPRQEGGHAMIDHAFPVEKYAPDQSWPVDMMPVRDGRKLVLPAPVADEPLRRQRAYIAGWHPCFSSPETIAIAAQNILGSLAADPDRQLVGLGVMDKGGHCECDACLGAVAGRVNAMGKPDCSELYYAWANGVVERVARDYPLVYFEVIAYREVFNPPSFALHPQIVVCLCLDIHQLMDPEVKTETWSQIKAWNERAQHLGLWEYSCGMNGYALPRVYYHLHAEFIREFHRHGGALAKFSGWTREGSEGEGPKMHLAMKLYWNAELDPDAVMDDWYRTTVGARAAPFLRRYFEFWEGYCTGEAIRRTAWFKSSVRNQYFRIWDWNRTRSYTFALQKGDMARLRRLMEQVVANAQTPDQVARARRLMLTFEYYEANAYALFSETVPPEGDLPAPELAVAMIEAVPRAFAYAEKRESILDRISAGHSASANRISREPRKFDIRQTLVDIFAKVGPHMGHPSVRTALDKLQANTSLPEPFKRQLMESCSRAYRK
jgi:hypothetical protein